MPAARMGDMHVCPLVTGVVPHVGGPIVMGCFTVLIGGLPAARVTDLCVCVGPPDLIVLGEFTVLIGGLPAARMLDMSAHGGLIVLGCFTVLIGASGGGGGGGAAGGAGAASSGPGGLPVTTVPEFFGYDDVKVGNAIVIDGSPEFQKKVLDRLDKIGKTRSGKELLDRIDKSGKTMTIVEYTGDNSFAGAEDLEAATGKGKPIYDGEGKPVNSWLGLGPQKVGTGKGSDVKLQFNPELKLPNSKNGPMPNDAVLFHEMTHGVHDMEGTSDCAPVPGWDTKEEQTTISTGTPSEADYLKESGYPYKRADHDVTWVANP